MKKSIFSYNFKQTYDYYSNKFTKLLKSTYANAAYERWGYGLFSPEDYAQPYSSEISGHPPGFFFKKRSIPGHNKWNYLYNKQKKIILEINYINKNNVYKDFETKYAFYLYNNNEFIKLHYSSKKLDSIIYGIVNNEKLIYTISFLPFSPQKNFECSATYIYIDKNTTYINILMISYNYLQRIKIHDTNRHLVVTDIKENGDERIVYGAEKYNHRCYLRSNIPLLEFKNYIK